MEIIARVGQAQDAPFILSALRDPSVTRHLNDDKTLIIPLSEANIRPTDFIIIEESHKIRGFFFVEIRNSAMVEIHTHIRGVKDKMKASRLTQELLRSCGFQKIISYIPAYNKAALRFAIASGFNQCGVITKSYLYNGDLIDQLIVEKSIGG